MENALPIPVRQALQRGLVIPACPLALTAERKLDERRQRALVRYYLAAGAGGLAVGVHTTQFAIRDPKHNLFKPVLELAIEEIERTSGTQKEPFVRIAGICGKTSQAKAEADFIRQTGFHAGLLSLGAMRDATEPELLLHCREIAKIIPIVGFYLQPAVGGRVLPYSFWRQFVEIENVVAIKIAPFNRYQTLEVVRAVAESGRDEIALYTGNDDNIILDLLTPFRFKVGKEFGERRFVGGLLGQWAVGTRAAVHLLAKCHEAVNRKETPVELLRLNGELTDTNAALFDAANGFAGCIPGIHEILRRQGLLDGLHCLDENETLSPGQLAEINRVHGAYPHLHDDEFIRQNIESWLRI